MIMLPRGTYRIPLKSAFVDSTGAQKGFTVKVPLARVCCWCFAKSLRAK